MGAEAALLTASMFPIFKAVVGFVGTHVVWQYSEMGMQDTIPYSHWSYKGNSIPFVPLRLNKEIYQNGLKTGIWGQMFENSLKDEKAVESAAIQVEKINAPILLFSGKDDNVWPSPSMSDAIIKRLKKYNYCHEYRHVCYPETGHILFVTKDGKTGGGTGKGAQLADEDSQKQLLAFFQKHLKR